MKDNMPVPSFLSGVVEGFYGRPWTNEQRRTLFRWMADMGLAVYMYAPKDDMKHRTNWRDLYTEAEAAALKETIENAREYGVHFVYAISPGLSVSYCSEEHRQTLMAKFEQVAGLGCSGFALLFDDINPELGEEDTAAFSSEGHAQAVLTSYVFRKLGRPQPFLFCPTEYCSVRARPSIAESTYLRDIGIHLDSEIDILWTGPLVLSRFVSPGEIAMLLTPVLRRAPVLWDNLHNNDYDIRRLHLGPVDGRPVSLRTDGLRGLLANPNVQLEANFVPLHTLGQWCCAGREEEFVKEAAHTKAMVAWTAELYPGDSREAVEEKERLTVEDLAFVADFFYLPYEYGENARRYLDCVRWLFNNSHLRATESFSTRENFIRHCQAQWKAIYSKLTFVPNREVAYILAPFTSDARFVCGAVIRFIMCLKMCRRPCHCFRYEAREAWDLRGGWFSEVENLLPDIRLEPVPPVARLPDPVVYVVRPALPTDAEELERLMDGQECQVGPVEPGEAEMAVDSVAFSLRRHAKRIASSSAEGEVFLLEAGGPIEGIAQVFPDWQAVTAALPDLPEVRVQEMIGASPELSRLQEEGGGRWTGAGYMRLRVVSDCPQGAVSRLATTGLVHLQRAGCRCVLTFAPNFPGPAKSEAGSPGRSPMHRSNEDGSEAGATSLLGQQSPDARPAPLWREMSVHEAGAVLSMDVSARGCAFCLCTRMLARPERL